jgi:hypothetical protein
MTVNQQVAIIQAKLREHTMGQQEPVTPVVATVFSRVNDPVWEDRKDKK